MTEWRAPGEPSAPLPDQPPQRGRLSRRADRQLQLLVFAGLILAGALVLVIVLLLRNGSNGPAPGSPDAVTDSFAAALRTGSAHQMRGVACVPARPVLRTAKAFMGSTTAASRQGNASLDGNAAVNRIAFTAGGAHKVGTVALSRQHGHWCVAAFAAASG